MITPRQELGMVSPELTRRAPAAPPPDPDGGAGGLNAGSDLRCLRLRATVVARNDSEDPMPGVFEKLRIKAESSKKTKPIFGRRQRAWGGRTGARGTLRANHVSRRAGSRVRRKDAPGR